MFLLELHTKWLVAKSGSLALIVNIDYPEILQHRIYPLSRDTRVTAARFLCPSPSVERASAFPQNERRRVR